MEEAEMKKVCVSGQRVKRRVGGVGNKEASGRRRKGNWNDENTVWAGVMASQKSESHKACAARGMWQWSLSWHSVEQKMGIQITLCALCANLHASMPPTGSTGGREGGRWESIRGGERSYTAVEGGEEITVRWIWEKERKTLAGVKQKWSPLLLLIYFAEYVWRENVMAAWIYAEHSPTREVRVVDQARKAQRSRGCSAFPWCSSLGPLQAKWAISIGWVQERITILSLSAGKHFANDVSTWAGKKRRSVWLISQHVSCVHMIMRNVYYQLQW